MKQDILIEKLARQIFENRKSDFESWDTVARKINQGQPVVGGIGDAGKEHYRKLAKKQLVAEGEI